MKNIIFIFLGLLLLNSCKAQYNNKNYDGVYYTPKKSTSVVVQPQKVSPDSIIVDESQYTDSQDNSVTYITNNYYENVYDYSYSSRIKRFHYNYCYDSYFSDYYTNLYWYDHNPFDWGINIYYGYNWWNYPYYTYYTYYSPYWYNPYWYWPNYYGWNGNGHWNYHYYNYSWNWHHGNNWNNGHNWYSNNNHRNYYGRRSSVGSGSIQPPRNQNNNLTIRQDRNTNNRYVYRKDLNQQRKIQPYIPPAHNRTRNNNEYTSPKYRQSYPYINERQRIESRTEPRVQPKTEPRTNERNVIRTEPTKPNNDNRNRGQYNAPKRTEPNRSYNTPNRTENNRSYNTPNRTENTRNNNYSYPSRNTYSSPSPSRKSSSTPSRSNSSGGSGGGKRR